MSDSEGRYFDPDGREIPVQCVGVSGPITLDRPTEDELQSTTVLEQTLRDMNIFETPAEITQRKDALRALQELCNNWVRKVAKEQNIPDHLARQYEGKVFTFGSYRIGVNTRGADIDALLVVPRFIDREAFFSDFVQGLEELDYVEDIHAVPDAFVPVLKMKFYGVEIDLLFAKLDRQSISGNLDLCRNTEEIFRNMEERDVRSVNGVRVTEEILHLVYNKETFKTSLRAIRMWARARGVYGNALGFFGGVTWAILVARVCQLCPVATASAIVCNFFNLFHFWSWPNPVLLKQTEEFPHLDYPVWDPRKNPSDQYHLLPIITPAFPAQNSTYNVTRSTKNVILKELQRGKEVVAQIMLGEKPWSALMEPMNFFVYKHYVVVIVTGVEKAAFLKLCGRVESRLRVLVQNFDNNERVALSHLSSRSFGRAEDVADEPQLIRKWIIGMEFQQGRLNSATSLNNLESASSANSSVDLSYDITNFMSSVTRNYDDPQVLEHFSVKYAKKRDLAKYLPRSDMDDIRKRWRAERLEQQQKTQQPATNASGTSQEANPSTSNGTEPSTGSSADAPTNEAQPDDIRRVDSTDSLHSNWAEELACAQHEEQKTRKRASTAEHDNMASMGKVSRLDDGFKSPSPVPKKVNVSSPPNGTPPGPLPTSANGNGDGLHNSHATTSTAMT